MMRLGTYTPCNFFIFTFLLVASNCTHQRSAQFIEAEYQPFKLKGAGTICGEAYLKTSSGEVKYGTGSQVLLDPATSYSTEWFEKEIIEGHALNMDDERIYVYRRSQTADPNGQFCFTDLPSGHYYLASNITWEFLNDGIPYTTSEWAYAQVNLNEGQTTHVILTRPNTPQRPF